MYDPDPDPDPDPLCLDPNREVVHSSLYNSLRTNLPRQLMGFSDYPFSTLRNQDPRTFPFHQEVLQFLTEFAHEFRLTELISFGAEVLRVERDRQRAELWIVESKQNGLNSVEVFDAVVVCIGHYTQPVLASFPGMEKWPGKQMHSHNYRAPDPFQDQIVVVIGDGLSAIDISLEISTVAKQVHCSSKSPNVKASKLDDVGDNIWQQTKIDHVDGDGQVVFQDGACIQADTILHCTGYKYDFPFLKTEGIVSVEDNRVGPLYKHVFPPMVDPNLSFVGLTCRAPIFLMIDLQAKWITNVLSGKASLPSKEDMLADVQGHYWCMEENGVPKNHTHCLNHKLEYGDWVAAQVGLLQGVDEHIKLVHRSFSKFLVENGVWRIKEWQIDHHGQQDGVPTLGCSSCGITTRGG